MEDAQFGEMVCGSVRLPEAAMVIGANDPDVKAMQELRGKIRSCPEPLVVDGAGHFVPEWGEAIARAALRSFGDL